MAALGSREQARPPLVLLRRGFGCAAAAAAAAAAERGKAHCWCDKGVKDCQLKKWV